jgi:hypothetical protein
MQLAVDNFGYLGMILEGLFFGGISVLSNPLQKSILAYLLCIYNVTHPEKRQSKRLISMLSVSYMCCLRLALLLKFEILWLPHL